MNRPIAACAFFAFATAALCAQQSTPSDPYQGTSNPPPDDTIESSAPLIPKPPAGKPLDAPVLPPAAQPQVLPPPQTQYAADPNGDPGAAPAPSLNSRSYSSDPDGDIVHPAPLPPGVIGEGTTIRVHLIEGLSTTDSQKGDPFRSTVASDVLENGQVLIPAGAEIDGHVVDVSSGHMGGHGSLRLRPEMVVMSDGKRYRLDAYVTGTPGSHARVDREGSIGADSRVKRDSLEYGGAMGAGAITGAALGGPAGALAGTLIGAGAVTVHLLENHPQATLEPGSVLLFTLTQPLDLVQTQTANSGSQDQTSTDSIH
jgi:hypothetical protein